MRRDKAPDVRGDIDVLSSGRPSGESYYSSTDGTKACRENEIRACVESRLSMAGLYPLIQLCNAGCSLTNVQFRQVSICNEIYSPRDIPEFPFARDFQGSEGFLGPVTTVPS